MVKYRNGNKMVKYRNGNKKAKYGNGNKKVKYRNGNKRLNIQMVIKRLKMAKYRNGNKMLNIEVVLNGYIYTCIYRNCNKKVKYRNGKAIYIEMVIKRLNIEVVIKIRNLAREDGVEYIWSNAFVCKHQQKHSSKTLINLHTAQNLVD